MSTVIDVSESNFSNIIEQSSTPVLIDFWAPWCGPCKAIAPVIDELSTELNGTCKVVKVNVDEAPQLAAKYGVRSIPTLVVVNKGELLDTKVGGGSVAELKAFIDSAISD